MPETTKDSLLVVQHVQPDAFIFALHAAAVRQRPLVSNFCLAWQIQEERVDIFTCERSACINIGWKRRSTQ